jgi:Centrosome microtubule-binding domain of Cep57
MLFPYSPPYSPTENTDHRNRTYQNKADEYVNLDPAVGKRRRKALTEEINELVAEMDYKCDQIYALYDVNEEFEGRLDSDEEEEEGNADATNWTIPESFVLDEDDEAGGLTEKLLGRTKVQGKGGAR